MKTKFTKGKWNCSEAMNFSDTYVCYITSDKKEQEIAQTRNNNDGKEEAEANAKLIAASPDLLKFGHELITKCVEKYDCIDITDELYNLTQAIKKATD